MPTVSIEFPTTLPVPDPGTLKPVERRSLSNVPGLQQVRQNQADYLATQEVSWLLTAAQAVIMYDWWVNTLLGGGLWFSADWPWSRAWVPTVRRFIGELVWEHAPGENWRVRGLTEIRGTGEALLSTTNCTGVAVFVDDVVKTALEGYYYELYRSFNPVPSPPVGMISTARPQARLPGNIYSINIVTGMGRFGANYEMQWDALFDGDGDVNIFSVTRVGVAPQPPDYLGGSATWFSLTLTHLPTESLPSCRVLLFMTAGSWESFPIFINSESFPDAGTGFPVPIANDLTGGGTRVTWVQSPREVDEIFAICILRCHLGELSTTWVTPDPGPPP